MSSGRTAGPWGVEECGGYRFNGKVVTPGYIVTAPGSSLPNVATVHDRRGESEGNARLIAAAPDMLAALGEVAHWYSNQERIDSAPWIYQVRDAIAGAGITFEGGAQ